MTRICPAIHIPFHTQTDNMVQVNLTRILLVHGPLADGSSWSKAFHYLYRAGYPHRRTTAVDFPHDMQPSRLPRTLSIMRARTQFSWSWRSPDLQRRYRRPRPWRSCQCPTLSPDEDETVANLTTHYIASPPYTAKQANARMLLMSTTSPLTCQVDMLDPTHLSKAFPLSPPWSRMLKMLLRS